MKFIYLLFILTFILHAQTLPIDMGSDGGNSGSSCSENITYVDLNNPSNHSGTIDSIQIKHHLSDGTAADSMIIVSFYLVTGTTYAARDTCVIIENGANGSTVVYYAGTNYNDLKVEIGDFIGFYTPSANGARIKRSTNDPGVRFRYKTGRYYTGSTSFTSSLATEVIGAYAWGTTLVPSTKGFDKNEQNWRFDK